MKKPQTFAALEIGTSRTVLALAELLENKHVRLIGMNAIPSTGVNKGVIADLQQAVYSLESAVRRIEVESRWNIGKVYLALNGAHITMREASAQKQLTGGKVTEDAIAELYEMTRTMGADDRNKEIIDICEQSYSLDGISNIQSPVGLSGNLLTLKSLVTEASINRIRDAKAAANNARLDVADVAYAGDCAARAVLTNADKSNGTLVIDIGGGCTNWVLYANEKMIHHNVIGVGGNHATEDIKQAFNITKVGAEKIKPMASAVIDPSRDGLRFDLPTSITSIKLANASLRALDTVVNARFTELFTIIKEDLAQNDLLHRMPNGVVLTGGAARTVGIDKLAESIFGTHVRIGSIINEIEGFEKEPFPAEYATIAGLLLYASQSTGDVGNDQPKSVHGFFKGIFGK